MATKIFKALPIALIFVLLSVCAVFAASTAVQKYIKVGDMNVLVVTWVAHTDGSFTSFGTQKINGVVGWIQTDPGATAPTTLYDITLKNENGFDIMGGLGADRSATATEGSAPYDSVNDLFLTFPVYGPLTFAITNNSVSEATGTLTIFYWGDNL